MKSRILTSILLMMLLPSLIILLIAQIAGVKTMDSFVDHALINRAIIVNNTLDLIPQVSSTYLKEATDEEAFIQLLEYKNNVDTSDYKSYKDQARKLMEESPIEDFFIMDDKGEVVLSKRECEEGLKLCNTNLYRIIMDGADISSDIIIGYDGIKKLRISLPMKQDGNIVGIVTGNLDSQNLVKTMRNLYADDTEDIYIIGSNVILFSKEREKIDYTINSDFKTRGQLDKLIADFRNGVLKEEEGVIEYSSYGKDMLGAFVKMKNAEGIVVFAKDKDGVYKNVQSNSKLFFGLYIVIITTAIVLGIIIVLKMHRHVKELQTHTKKISEGEYVKCTFTEGSEFAEICKNINRISDNLQRSEKALWNISKMDGLTRLPIFTSLDKKINDLLYEDEQQALLMIVFDGFESINHNYGHDIGDQAFEEIGHILRNLPEGCYPARLSGCWFLVFMSGLEQEQSPEKLANSIIEKVRDIHFINDTRITIDVSIGIKYVLDGDKVEPDLDNLIKLSNYAMDKARSTGKNTYIVYDELDYVGL